MSYIDVDGLTKD